MNQRKANSYFSPSSQQGTAAFTSKSKQKLATTWVEVEKTTQEEELTSKQENQSQISNILEKEQDLQQQQHQTNTKQQPLTNTSSSKRMNQTSDVIIEQSPEYIEKQVQPEQGKFVASVQRDDSALHQNQCGGSRGTNKMKDQYDSPNDTTHSANGSCSSSSASSISTTNKQTQEQPGLSNYPMFDSGSSSQAPIEIVQDRESQFISAPATNGTEGKQKEAIFNVSGENKGGEEQQQQQQGEQDNKQDGQKDSKQSDYQYLFYVSSSNTPNENNNNNNNNNNNSPMNDFGQKGDLNSRANKPSKVLLVMVQNPQDEVIEHRVIFEKFNVYGEVEQILIFSKKQPWKIFVDMSSIEVATRAKIALENSSIFVNGMELKMRVQYSNSQYLILKNGNGGINYKELNKRFEKTQLSYSIQIDPSQQQSQQHLYQSAQLMDLNRRQYGAIQSMQLPNPQQNQMLKFKDPTTQSMAFTVAPPKVQVMSTTLVQQEQPSFIPQQIQQMTPIGMPTPSGIATIQQPSIFAGRDSPQMISSAGLAHGSINMTGSAQMQQGSLLQMNPFPQYEQIQQPMMYQSFGNQMLSKDDTFLGKQTPNSSIFQHPPMSHQYINQSMNLPIHKPEMTSSLQYPIHPSASFHHTVNMTQSMHVHSSSINYQKPPQESIFAQNNNMNNDNRNNSVEQLDDILEIIQKNQLDTSGEVSQDNFQDFEEQKSNSYEGVKDFEQLCGEKNDIYQENQMVTSQQMYNSLNKNSKIKSPFSSDMKTSGSGPLSQHQILTTSQPYAPQMTSSFQRMNKEMNHSNSSSSIHSNSQSPMTGFQKLDKLLGQAQGSDTSNDEEYPLSDDEGTVLPFIRQPIQPQQQQQVIVQQQQQSLESSIKSAQFGAQNNFYINMQGSAGQPNLGANTLMTSSAGQPLHGNMMMQPFIQNQPMNPNGNMMNSGSVQMISSQPAPGTYVNTFPQANPNNVYQTHPSAFGMPVRQNHQQMPPHMNQNYAQSCMLMNPPASQNMHLLQQSAQVNLQQQFDNQPTSYSVQIRPNYHSMSTNLAGQRMEEHMGTFHGSTYIKQGFLEDSKPSQVIYVNHLMNKEINVNHLYNVFSNFGDITKIILKRQKCTAFIEFTQQENATKAKEYMDKKIFFDNEIRVFYSHFETLLKQEDKNQEQFIGNEQTHRFQKDAKMTLNPPSLVLHISSLKQEICDHEKMHELFRPYGKIEAIHIEKVPPRYMCHIKFSALKESLMAVAHMHNKDVKGRKMLISFTRKKLDTTTKNLVTYSKNIQLNN